MAAQQPDAQKPSARRSQREFHAWGRFGSGTWKLIRLVSESLDEEGNVTSKSTTETRTTLGKIDNRHFTLKVEATVDVAGRKLAAPTKIDTRGYYGEAEDEKVTFLSVSEENVTIGKRKHSCKVRDLEISSATRRRKVRVFFDSRRTPSVLRKVVTGMSANEDKKTYQTTYDVIALDMPYRVGNKTLSTSRIRQVHTNHAGTTVTLAVHSPLVPGEVVAYWAKELDSKGRLIRLRTLQLVDYAIVAPGSKAPPTPTKGVLRRIKERRETRREKRGE